MVKLVFAKYLQLAIFVLTIWVSAAMTAYGGISGSGHDMSGKGWGTNEICIFCHTPHNANKTVANAPLWNHQVTTATFIMYSSPTLQVTPEPQPRGPSKLCLSCHDGTVAIDSFGNRTGTQFMSGSANLGTDLSNDHPISIPWSHRAGTGGNCLTCHSMHGGGGELKPNLPLRDGFIECVSCHEPHNKYGHAHMTRYTMDQSELCLKCHAK